MGYQAAIFPQGVVTCQTNKYFISWNVYFIFSNWEFFYKLECWGVFLSTKLSFPVAVYN